MLSSIAQKVDFGDIIQVRQQIKRTFPHTLGSNICVGFVVTLKAMIQNVIMYNVVRPGSEAVLFMCRTQLNKLAFGTTLARQLIQTVHRVSSLR